MTTYRLKDRRRQRLLDELTDGEFTLRMLEEIEKLRRSALGWNPNEDRVFVDFGKPMLSNMMSRQFRMAIEVGEIEEANEPCETDWQAYPAVMPPEGRVVEAEYYADTGEEPQCVQRSPAVFSGGRWHSPDGDKDLSENAVLRFRALPADGED